MGTEKKESVANPQFLSQSCKLVNCRCDMWAWAKSSFLWLRSWGELLFLDYRKAWAVPWKWTPCGFRTFPKE